MEVASAPEVPRSVLATTLVLLIGCAYAHPEDDFGAAFDGHAAEFGDGKSDFPGFIPGLCDLLEPLMDGTDATLRSGLVVGVQGSAVLGVGTGFGGYDMVWNLYHQQFLVSRYLGAGIATPGLGASAQGYVGFAAGFEESVAEWTGWFVTGSADVGLPFLKDFIGLTPAIFVTGEDRNGDGFIDPTEVLIPPEGIYGFQVGVSLGFDVPDPLPVKGALTEGHWRAHDPAIRFYYDFFRSRGVKAHLVDVSGAPCPDGWPHDGSGRTCVIQFGTPNAGWLSRSRHTAKAICNATGGCVTPLTWPMSATAIAIGALRASGLRPGQLCK